MGNTQSKTFCLISLGVVFGLVGCVNNTGALKLTEQDKQWFCVPQESEEWLCEKDDTSFKQRAPVKPAETESKWTVGKVPQKVPQKESINDVILEESDKSEELDRGDAELEVLAANEPNSNDGLHQPPSIASSASTQSSSPPSAEPSQEAPSDSSATTATEESVRVKDTYQPPSSDISPWVVQLAAYRAEDSAERFVQSIGQGHVFKTRVNGERYFTVVLLGFDTRLDAEQAAQAPRVSQLGISPWIRRGASLKKSLFD